MQLLIEQVERRLAELGRWLEVEVGGPAEIRLHRTDGDSGEALAPGGEWRVAIDSSVWLRFRLRRPDHWPIEDTALVAQRFGTYPLEPNPRVGRDLQRMQGMLYLDGRPYHGLDQYHRLIYLPAGPEYELAANVWTGFAELDWQPNPVFRLVRTDPGVVQLYHDLRVLANALRALPVDNAARTDLERVTEGALLAIDWSCPGEAAFRASCARAHEAVTSALGALHGAEYEPTMTVAGHAHIDCAWLWPISQTRQKAGRTWSTALRLMERYPEYRFLASSPLQYQMVKEDFPETFAGIRERVREGRWETVGGMWVEADCNLPDGESLARQMLLGTRYFEREFGVETRVVWLPDTFGFTWALPTLMAAAGLRYFVTHKLSWSQTNRIPHDTFRWRGPDGGEVLAHFLCTPSLSPGEHTTYNGTLLPSIMRGAWTRFQDRELQRELLVAFGHGDGGGGPTLDMVEAGRRLVDLPGFPKVKMGRADEFFARLDEQLAERADVPIWDGELYLEYHRGTYTGQARQKLRNALSQRLYHAAELYAAMARALLGSEYPRAALDEGWRLLLTNQFHDILPGSAISAVYADAEADYTRLAQIGQGVLDEALDGLTAGIGLGGESVVVFNPAPFESAEYVVLPKGCQVANAPSQVVDDGVVTFVEGVPPNGYAALLLGDAGESGSSVSVSEQAIETPYWSIDIDGSGRITRLWDKRLERDVVPSDAPGNRLVVFEDKPLNYDAWDIDAYYAAKSREVDDLEAIEVRESGPERGVLELRWRFGAGTRIVQRLVVYARSPRIDFVTDVDWHERQSLLKVGFRTGLRNRRASYEIQFGSIDRPTHRNTTWEAAAFEVPGQRWVDLSDAHVGVALLSDCKHGYSVDEDTLWLSLLKGAVDPDPEADLGAHHFTYSLLPHGPGLDEVRRAAYRLTRPLLWRRTGPHAGPLPTRASVASVDDPSVIVETVKWAEDEDALVLRTYESEGGAVSGRLSLGVAARRVDEVDLLERNAHAVSVDSLRWRAREVKTLMVRT